MRLSVEASGAERAARRLRILGGRADDARPAMREARDELAAGNLSRMSSGRGLKRLAPATRQRKSRLGQSSRPLHATGALEDSLRPGGRGNVSELDASGLKYGTSVFYARFHQQGKGVPRRRVISVGKPVRLRIAQIVLDHITDER